jgi:serine/threonine protein kinase
MICCLNPNCLQENPSCPDQTKFCSSCGTELILLSGRYRPIRRIGKGGFGITYLAEDNGRFNKPCVIKQLVLQVPDAKRLFEDEARRLEELADYPAIPRLLAYHSDLSYLYLVQEFVVGQDLGQELQEKGTKNELQVKDFLHDILPILSMIHGRGIVHRDIKLDNIMRGADDKLVLIDFGISKIIPINNTVKPGTMAGTSGYAAPEQMKDGIATPASDLYSLGAACFHLLTNVRPEIVFIDYGYQWTKNWQQHLTQPVSKELVEIIEKLLIYEYLDRFQSATEVINALSQQALASSAPTLVSSSSPAPSTIIINNAVPHNKALPNKNPPDQKNLARNLWVWPLVAGALLISYYSIYSLISVVDKTLSSATKEIKNTDNNTNKTEEIDNKKKIADFTQEIKNNPDSYAAYMGRADARFADGESQEAIKDYDQTIKLNPDYGDAYGNRGNAWYKLGDLQKAIADYNKAIELNADDAAAYHNRGMVRNELGEYQSALKDLNQAIKLKADEPDFYAERSNSKYGIKNYQGALEDAEQAIKLKADNPNFYVSRGNARLLLNDDKQGSLQDYKKAASLYQTQGLVPSTDKNYQGLLQTIKDMEK